jgi:hypothetical protein
MRFIGKLVNIILLCVLDANKWEFTARHTGERVFDEKESPLVLNHLFIGLHSGELHE